MTTLGSLKVDWESLAERDALHAILTDVTKAGGQWNIAEFMAAGNTEIEMVMRHLARLGCIPNREGVALDSGCGVGRLTQALGHYFDSCMGVDISEAMVQQAQSLNELPHCRYIATSDIPRRSQQIAFHSFIETSSSNIFPSVLRRNTFTSL